MENGKNLLPRGRRKFFVNRRQTFAATRSYDPLPQGDTRYMMKYITKMDTLKGI